MIDSFLSARFPSSDITDGYYLYKSLGSFWTRVFQDKNALKGYTIGMAEEAIQAYYNLIETINKYSVKDIDLYHTEKWLPLRIKKSEFNKTPFVFSADSAVFGLQPDTDPYYKGQLFRFGFPKETMQPNVFSFTPSFKLGNVGAIADRVISPTVLLTQGVSFTLKDNTIIFNVDIFSDNRIAKVKIIDDFGVPVLFEDTYGNKQEDELIILWMYHANIDRSALAENFGTLFDLQLPTAQSYKDLLKSLMNLFVAGPTISSLNAAIAALCDIPIASSAVETVETIYSDDSYSYVVTDKQVYRFSIAYRIRADIQTGKKLYAGDIITEELSLIDNTIRQTWWLTDLKSDKLAFSSHVFAASINHQLLFENKSQKITYLSGKINFPVLGTKEDVDSFQEYINLPENKQVILAKLKINPNENAALVINPLDFVFENFFKNNTFLISCQFSTETQLRKFFNLFDTLKPYMPSHVYFLVYINLKFAEDLLDNLNRSVVIADYPGQLFCADGSVSNTGERPGDPVTDPLYYKDLDNRMFCVSVGPYKNNGTELAPTKDPLHHENSLDTLMINNSAVRGDNSPGIRCGLMRTYIPETVTPPGESSPRIPSTKEIQSILLIDF